MSAQLRPQAAAARLVLLGTGTVGSAFIARYQALRQRQLDLPLLHVVANSRIALACGDAPEAVLSRAKEATRQGDAPAHAEETGRLQAGDIVVDATASEDIAAEHAHWLARGIHVVTANKLGNGTTLARARRIGGIVAAGSVRYGDSATVGAGLPLLSSIRALVAGGDHVHAIEGVLSGSLAWLFHRFDGSQPFSACVREAAAAGYTEPDPRIDLSGEDVRRKLLILARAAGVALEPEQVEVESLLPPALAALPAAQVDAALAQLDAPLAARLQQARGQGLSLCFVARLDGHGASVGLRALPADHPVAGGRGTDNRVAIRSDRYRGQPLLIQGPGAGADVTAAALLDDVLGIARR
ncbi:homoserine dehydrogenase [Stenotrophomonas sp. CW117]|uniref:homoserine dehydrogenase n=1 Tax=Stenotrophomonas TaxID=40323 RepID=UPI0007036CA9|nr:MULTISPECIES: homoserine dehydrogenase [Stenotrophomonas]KRG86434.1 homoserine dehydrogenase [Stenotrophomonas acidaminiphila]QOF97736.1 homoserine dehydrogenase [Stenotrophomonas sp. CW117]